MLRCVFAFVPALLLAVATGCAGTGSGPGGDGDGDGDTDRTTYPAGPFGTAEGDVIDDLAFELADGSPFTFNDVYADPANKLLLLSTAAGWCTACREEQASLQALQDEHGADGLYVMVTLFEDNSYQPATGDFVQSWIDQYDVTFRVVLDEPFVMDAYYDSTLTPMNMYVDLDTMEIIRITVGWDPAVADAIIAANL